MPSEPGARYYQGKDVGSVCVVVPTFGDKGFWDAQAKTAIESAHNQSRPPDEVVRIHADNLGYARNYGADGAESEWLIFLDADDTLDFHYVEAMLNTEGDIRRPATLGIYADGSEDDYPVMIPRRDLFVTNYIVIGAMIRREFFWELGGFDETLPCLEDWDLWLRAFLAGAQINDVPEAIYRVNVRSDSRNQDQGLHNRTYNMIKGRYRHRR